MRSLALPLFFICATAAACFWNRHDRNDRLIGQFSARAAEEISA